MKIAIVECTTDCEDAHVRQAKFIRDFLISKGHDCIILYKNTLDKYVNQKYDVIIKSYCCYHENYKAETKLYLNNKENAKFFFITNEYTIQTRTVFQKMRKEHDFKCSIIANFKNISDNYWYKNYFVNLNALFFQPKEIQKKKYKVCYYGTYRKDRKKYFKKYFVSKGIHLSTNIRSFKKFAKDGCQASLCKKFIWGNKKDTLGLFKYSLYIEDEWIHNNFHNLADRFYEAMSNQTVTLFDKSCIHTLENSELKDKNYKDFIIDSYEEIEQRDYDKDWEKQKLWLDELQKQKENVLEEIYRIITC